MASRVHQAGMSPDPRTLGRPTKAGGLFAVDSGPWPPGTQHPLGRTTGASVEVLQGSSLAVWRQAPGVWGWWLAGKALGTHLPL